jgi:hypothetical protein
LGRRRSAVDDVDDAVLRGADVGLELHDVVGPERAGHDVVEQHVSQSRQVAEQLRDRALGKLFERLVGRGENREGPGTSEGVYQAGGLERRDQRDEDAGLFRDADEVGGGCRGGGARHGSLPCSGGNRPAIVAWR